MNDIIGYIINNASRNELLTAEEEIELAKRIKAGDTEAKNRLAEANMRLVINIANNFRGYGLEFEDLFQEGNLGLLKAIDKFDYTKGYRLTTYAIWWIRQSIMRAIANKSKAIRLPVHLHLLLSNIKKYKVQYTSEHGKEPSKEEIAKKFKISVKKLEEILKCDIQTISFETPIGEDDERSNTIGDIIADDDALALDDIATHSILKEQLLDALDSLNEREKKVLKLRYGLEDGRARSYREIGKEFNLTHERIKQIEVKALKKLKRNAKVYQMKEYLEVI